ncbi:U1 small nuclear ribonucleoprotein of 70kDa MW N terminal-domain-containing protein [Lipomyces starkeyi]
MTDKLPPPLLALFAPRPPLRYLPPSDTAPANRRTARISGVAKFLEILNTPEPSYVPTETKAEEIERLRREKLQAHENRLKDGLESWNPNSDPLVKGDPFQTLFISRLSLDTTEQDLDDECGRYGQIERIRIVRDKISGKPRGYAFVVFTREKDMRVAYKDMNGVQIKGRRVLVDVERGRTVKSWKPRRLGGGLGGRHYTKAGLLRPVGKDLLREKERESDRFRQPERERERHDRDRYRARGGGREWDRERERDRVRDRDHDRDRFRDRHDRDRNSDRSRWRR